MNNNKSTKSFKGEESTATINSGFLGFNLADFSLTPVVRKGDSKSLINTKHTHNWTGVTAGKKRDFFIERSYGHVAPNAYTEDFLILLATMAFQRDDPTKIPVSATSLLTIQGYTSLPGGDNIHRVFDHLDALSETRLHTNALYNRDTSSWYAFKGSPVGGFTYVDDQGKTRNTIDKNGREVEITVRELGTASLTAEFYEAFLQDCVSLDLKKYFNVGGPTARRLYKMGMKYIQTLGDFEIDLQECCIARLGMLPHVVLNKSGSALAKDFRPQANKVSEAGDFDCILAKSQTPSGYKICFKKQVTQLSLPGFPKTLQGNEKKARGELVKRKVNKDLAYRLVIESRRYFGNSASRYISWVLKKYDQDLLKGGIGPGVIKGRLQSNISKGQYEDVLQQQRLRANRKEARLYPEGANGIGDLFGNTNTPLAKLKKADLSVFDLIVSQIEEEYAPARLKKLGFDKVGKEKIRMMKEGSKDQWARKTLREWETGNTDFRPFSE